jgi:lipoprotein NlpD
MAGFIHSRSLWWCVILLLLNGCATAPVSPVTGPAGTPKPPAGIPGIYHKVKKGETLWRISKMYGIDLAELAQINRIENAASIEIDQQILIPHRTQPVPICIEPANSEEFIWPIKGTVVASFGQSYNNMICKGITIKPLGESKVVAARTGKVVFAAQEFGRYGKTVIIDHGDGLSTVYTGSGEVLIKPGEMVSQGMTIAHASEHVHFQIRKGYTAQNPYFYLPR